MLVVPAVACMNHDLSHNQRQPAFWDQQHRRTAERL